eukprot:1227233-Ditylum_brightwellii.AAC.1
MALPTALRRGGAMVIDASGPSLLVLFVVGGFAWVGGRRLRQQRPTTAQRRHGSNVGVLLVPGRAPFGLLSGSWRGWVVDR